MTDPARGAIAVDTSAAVCVILGEPDSGRVIAELAGATARLMSAATRVELGIVVEARLTTGGADAVAGFLRDAEVSIIAVDSDAAERAVSAWRRYGKGRHAAALNFGDCFSYALAEQRGVPLLFTGADFAATDLGAAIADVSRTT